MSKFAIAAALATVVAAAPVISEAQSGKPNIVIIWGDDIGRTNISLKQNGAARGTAFNRSDIEFAVESANDFGIAVN